MATIGEIIAANPAAVRRGRVIPMLSTGHTQEEAIIMASKDELTTEQRAAADSAALLAEELAALLEEGSDGNERHAGDLRNLATQLVNFRRVVDVEGARVSWMRIRTAVEPEIGLLSDDLETEARSLIAQLADCMSAYTNSGRAAAGGGATQ